MLQVYLKDHNSVYHLAIILLGITILVLDRNHLFLSLEIRLLVPFPDIHSAAEVEEEYSISSFDPSWQD